MKSVTILIAAALSATLAPAALAEQASVRVQYADLDLSSPAGKKALTLRISRAARTVCGDGSGSLSLAESNRIGACVKETREQAIAAVLVRRDIQLAARR